MARFYADENFDYQTVVELRALGHDVRTVQEAGNRGGTDEHVLAFATKDGRAVLTHDRRDFEQLHQLDPNHGGIVSCTLDDATALAARVNSAIKAVNDLSGLHIRVNLPP